MTTKITSSILANTAVSAGTYGGTSTIPVVILDAQGRATYAANSTITGVATLTSGTWNASTIGTGYGGTGLTSFTSGGAVYATSTSTLTSGTLPITAGGTGQTSAAGALTALLPTGTTAGYVLTTGGPGSFYWAAAGGGGAGATPGTTINSSRLFYTATAGQTVFTTPTYTPGASQLRVYLNGVRQFNSAYTETSNTSVTLNEGCDVGENVMIEVDGYIINPYYANNITYGPATGDIPGTANTIQLAIDSLENRKAALIGATFTGDVRGITMATSAANTSFATTLFVSNFSSNATNITSGTLPNARLANSSVTINGTSVSLGSSATIKSSINGVQIFTSSGTFTIPSGITALKVTVIGGGGGGGNPGVAGGNSTLTSGTQTISTITATGGTAGQNGGGNAGGTASGGDINLSGGGGSRCINDNGTGYYGCGGAAGGGDGVSGFATNFGYVGGGGGGPWGRGGSGSVAASGFGSGGAYQSTAGGGGGGAGIAIKWLTGLTPGNTLTVTVGAPGGAGTSGAVIFEY